jgi:hypothetical protein
LRSCFGDGEPPVRLADLARCSGRWKRWALANQTVDVAEAGALLVDRLPAARVAVSGEKAPAMDTRIDHVCNLRRMSFRA